MKDGIIHIPLLVTLILVSSTVHSEALSFPEIWVKIRRTSPAQDGVRLKVLAADEGKARAHRHWLPRVYLDARTYRTNDPGLSFLGVLEQRKLDANDFAPDSLNHPESDSFTRGALGIDLALYEGGRGQAQTEAYDHISAAERFVQTQIEIEEYSQSALAYASISSILKQKRKLVELSGNIGRLMREYQLGQKANPIGYSGLLGMRSLAIRVAGLIEQMAAQEKAHFALLREMGVNDPDWTPQELDARQFVDQYLARNISASKDSYRVLAGDETVKASEKTVELEQARYLPRVGAFAESYTFSGRRDTANGYAAGLYLQWNLLDPNDFGRYKEAKLKAAAADRFNASAAHQERAERSALIESVKASKSNLDRLEDSDQLLVEQTQVSTTLFKDGSIGALQFVEILNRRTDLISHQTEAELSYLRSAASLVSRSKFEIPTDASPGGVR